MRIEFKRKNKGDYQKGSFFSMKSSEQKKVVRKSVRKANEEQKEMVDKYLRAGRA